MGSLVGPPAKPIPPGRYDLRVLESLRRITRAVDLHSRKLVARHKITGPQLVCLLSLQENDSATPSTLARSVHLSPSTVIGIIDRLEAKGLARRERDRKDRRIVHVALTAKGRRLAARAPSPLQDTLAEAMGGLPESERATIAASLARVVEMMEARHAGPVPDLSSEPPDRTAASIPSPDGVESEP